MRTPLVLTDDEIRDLGSGGIVCRDAVVTPGEVRAWSATLREMDEQAWLTPAGMGRGAVLDETLRGDRTAWLGDLPDDRLGGLRELFEAVRVELNRAAWLGLRDFTVQLAVYPGDGARYVTHVDALADDPVRRATAILYLNPDWRPAHGGCLRVSLPEGPREIEPVGGRLVVFLSDRVEHCVLPTAAVRCAATAWYRGPEAVLS